MGRLTLAAFGCLLILSFFGLTQTEVGLRVGFTGGFTNSVPAELHFWLATSFLLIPGGLLLGFSFASRVGPQLERFRVRLGAATDREIGAGALWVFLLGTLAAVLLNQFVLLGFPITDDEQFIRYGGQLLASGRVSEPVPDYLAVMPTWLLYVRDGALSSFDWLGGQIAWAIAEVSGTGTAVFALCAGAFFVGTLVTVGIHAGRSWGLVALLVAATSPMAVFLSGTSHAHVVSRGMLALSLAGYVLSWKRGGRWWVVTGLFTGAAFITRPPEIALLWLPLGLAMLWDARDDRAARKALAAFALGLLPLCALFIAHSFAVTGTPLPARLMPNELGELHSAFRAPLAFLGDSGLLWSRFGANSGYNLFMLQISFWGVLGLPFVVLGAGVDRFSRLLALGVVLDLSLGLLHDHYGLHLVGPIHYSEAAVPLIVLATLGIRRSLSWVPDRGHRYEALAMLLLGVLIAFGISNVWYLSALHRQAKIHETIHSMFDDPRFDDSVVLGPSYSDIWTRVPHLRETQTFVYQWPPMDPGRTDRVLFGHFRSDEVEALAALRLAFPDRKFYVIGATPEPPWVRIAELDSLPTTSPRPR